MQVPGNWESRGLEDFDGVVWFTRTIEAPQGAGEMTLSLGRISNTAEVWVNGLSVAQNATPPPAAGTAAAPGGGRGGWRGAAPAAAAPPAGGRGNLPYELPTGTLKTGRQHGHGAHHQQPQRRRVPRYAGDDVRAGRRDADSAGRRPGSTASSGRAMPVRCTRSRASWRPTSRWPVPPHPRPARCRRPAVRAAPDVVIRLSVKSGRDAVRQDRAERRAGPAGRDRLHQPGHHAAQLRARPAGLAQGDRHRPPTISRGRPTGRRSSTCRRFSRCCSRPSWSSPAKR